MQEDREPTAASSDAWKAQEAVAAGMEAYLYEESSDEEASDEEAFARALGRAVELYLDSLEGAERVRVLLDV